MLRIFYHIVWTFVYFIYLFGVFMKRVKQFFGRKYMKLTNPRKIEDELEILSHAVKLMDKIPYHVVLVLGNETISYTDLASVIIWCVAAGVSFLSFYDYTGVLKINENELHSMVSHVHKKYAENVSWGKKCLSNRLPILNGNKNGFFPHRTRVNVFSLHDGKGSIIKVAQQLCYSALENRIKSADVTQDLINKMVQNETGVPDPDIAVYCGSSCCTYGLLPWQIRVTEFVQLYSHHNIMVTEFINILLAYSKCEQRFGK